MTRANQNKKPRVIISTDFPPLDCLPGGVNYGPPEKKSDLDDIQSMIRFLSYSNEFRVEGLIASAATFANIANKQGILDVIDKYELVHDNLCLHNPEYPTPDDLREITKVGLSGAYAAKVEDIIGDGKDTEASDHIIKVIDSPDPNPVWVCFWGGPRELGQALWKVRNTRSDAKLSEFISKIRVYFVGLQDGSGQWMLDNFPELKTVTLRLYHGMANRSIFDGSWLREHIINNHGALGALYPSANWVIGHEGVYEGDTPSFLYLLSSVYGLSDLEKPWFGGWGGAFEINENNNFEGSEDAVNSIAYWEKARNWDFAARMDWCVKGYKDANHNPVAILNGDTSTKILYTTVKPGETVFLNANGSFDPDGNSLAYHWFQYIINTNDSIVHIKDNLHMEASFIAPEKPCEIHIILEVTDNGTPNLSSYRRLVVKVE